MRHHQYFLLLIVIHEANYRHAPEALRVTHYVLAFLDDLLLDLLDFLVKLFLHLVEVVRVNGDFGQRLLLFVDDLIFLCLQRLEALHAVNQIDVGHLRGVVLKNLVLEKLRQVPFVIGGHVFRDVLDQDREVAGGYFLFVTYHINFSLFLPEEKQEQNEHRD